MRHPVFKFGNDTFIGFEMPTSLLFCPFPSELVDQYYLALASTSKHDMSEAAGAIASKSGGELVT